MCAFVGLINAGDIGIQSQYQSGLVLFTDRLMHKSLYKTSRTAIELFGGWALDKLFHMQWWDYSDLPFNFHGYICLKFSIFWGIGVVLVVMVLHPIVSLWPFILFESPVSWIILACVYVIFAADLVITVLTVRGLAKDLAEIERLGKALHSVSDNMTVQIGEGTLKAQERIESQQVQAALAKAEMRDRMETARTNAEKRRAEMKAQLAQAEAVMKETEPALLQAKKAFEEGRAGLEKAKQMLIYAEAQLIAGTKELQEKQAEQLETKEDLDRRKAELESEAERLEEALREVEDYRNKKDRFNTLRYALLADEGIAARVREGEDLIVGAETELAQRAADTQREYELRLAAAIAMLASAVFGLGATAAAFRDRRSVPLLMFSGLAFASASAAEAVSYAAGRGMIYTVLFVGLFGAALLALNLKKA